MNFLLDVLLEDAFGGEEVGLEVLLVDSDLVRAVEGLEGDGVGLDVGGDVGEVEEGVALVEGHFAYILNECEIVIVDGDSEGLLLSDGGGFIIGKCEC